MDKIQGQRGANSASFSLKFKMNAMGSPDMKPATEDVKKANNPEIASRTFICDDRTLVVFEVVANCSKELIRSPPKFLVAGSTLSKPICNKVAGTFENLENRSVRKVCASFNLPFADRIV